jgi:hypothetical protein
MGVSATADKLPLEFIFNCDFKKRHRVYKSEKIEIRIKESNVCAKEFYSKYDLRVTKCGQLSLAVR